MSKRGGYWFWPNRHPCESIQNELNILKNIPFDNISQEDDSHIGDLEKQKQECLKSHGYETYRDFFDKKGGRRRKTRRNKRRSGKRRTGRRRR
jgi:hypothetical protein